MKTVVIVKTIYMAGMLLFLGGIMYGTVGTYLVNKEYLYGIGCDSVPEVTKKYEARF